MSAKGECKLITADKKYAVQVAALWDEFYRNLPEQEIKTKGEGWVVITPHKFSNSICEKLKTEAKSWGEPENKANKVCAAWDMLLAGRIDGFTEAQDGKDLMCDMQRSMTWTESVKNLLPMIVSYDYSKRVKKYDGDATPIENLYNDRDRLPRLNGKLLTEHKESNSK